jgi:hypothetical protein
LRAVDEHFAALLMVDLKGLGGASQESQQPAVFWGQIHLWRWFQAEKAAGFCLSLFRVWP